MPFANQLILREQQTEWRSKMDGQKEERVLPSEGVSNTMLTESSPELSHGGLILRTLS